MNSTCVTFGIFTDIHTEIMPDGRQRLAAFLDACQKKQVDFMIQLGDFYYPPHRSPLKCPREKIPVNVAYALHGGNLTEGEEIFQQFRSNSIPHYSVLGNHDLDFWNKEEAVRALDLPGPYYSFAVNGFHFIVLDGNWYRDKNGIFHPYDHGDYFCCQSDELPWLDPQQLTWLEKELEQIRGTVVIFSHQSLHQELYAIRNHHLLHQLLCRKAQTDGNFIVAINGHNHIDHIVKKDQIWYWNLNSISNCWLGEDFAADRYGSPIDNLYPNVRYTAPYQDPLFAIAVLHDHRLEITGQQSCFIGPSAEELGFPAHRTCAPVTAKISSFSISG